ncbi:DUF6777 domain-containing protein [Streptomyces solicathayae]|uniref:DUF6777 domain-containing protein n=1 Tax=Streptomyces solicathayae TaxID=3081768 RepID=A0ABZ0LMM4_9ACTN|nr:DUF6777 domain-containing protein [Streptomyces sp. HUAS YS2]WOX20748.1 DUF6777 domain-containing protein [Streptomyces sp. HUAS YS2]
MRASIRRSRAAVPASLAALGVALLLGGCAAGGVAEQPAAADTKDVLLQPVADRGPDPFTPSTAATPPALPRDPSTAPTPSSTPPDGAQRQITGSTPGLYGGTRSRAGCDVEQQIAFLADDSAKARAFSEGAGINEANLASWLRDLTPVVLRADVRVTNHGYRDGAPTEFQSVLQAGTAVLVDRYGAPRVRCACGNPLRSPVALRGAAHTGKPWAGFHPGRVVVVQPTTTVIESLVIVDVVHHSWIERKTGTDGHQDRDPVVVPPCDPDECDLVTDPPAPVPEPSDPEASPSPDRTGAPRRSPDSSTDPDAPSSPPPPSSEAPTEPDRPAPEDLFPSAPEGPDGPADQGVVPPGLPETFEV